MSDYLKQRERERKLEKIRGKASSSPKRKGAKRTKRKLPRRDQVMLAIMKNAHDEGDRRGAYFGVKKEKAAVRRLAGAGLARIVSETKKGPEGPELYALPTAAGLRAYESGYIQ